MAKKTNNQVEFPFFQYLRSFLQTDGQKVYKTFSLLSRKFLDHNNPTKNAKAYLRQPQFEALEIYVFLKEFTNNKHLSDIFEDWFNKQNEFEGRTAMGLPRDARQQFNIFSILEEDTSQDQALFREVFQQLNSVKQIYPNYIFALTMGLGKTVLMATTIFYEFLLANKYPKDERYCHNALVFAPDKTVLQSLREIQTFDLAKVVPQEYVSWLQTNVKFFFLDDTGDALNAIDHSSFNIIISNTQKIILKKEHKAKTPTQELFSAVSSLKLNQELLDLYGFEGDSEPDLIYNQRFAKLTKLKQLGVYVDEAHHVFGKALADDLFNFEKNTSLRFTINSLASMLKEKGTKVVGCYNYTGTPYVGSRLLPEVVYSYGLQSAIDNKFLKKVKISGFENIKNQTTAFVRLAIREFWERYGTEKFEGMLPKMAFFASSIAELETELRPAVETVLVELGISTEKILVNVGDEKLTTNDDIREFNSLDSVRSEKQFILLVNKGKEGWNCRSLFGVALHREPKSKIFVLQATMRCLRKIGDAQETGLVFLSDENVRILDEELQGNFRLTVEQLNKSGSEDDRVEVRLVPPPVKLKLKRSRKLHQIKPKVLQDQIDLRLDSVDTERYRIIRTERSIYDLSKKISKDEDVTDIKEKRTFSELTLTAEIARYLNHKPLAIKQILRTTKEGYDGILKAVNEFNELLYDYIIPHLFNELYDLIEFTHHEEIEIELVKPPKEGDCYKLKASRELMADMYDIRYRSFQNKSFHLDKYCFDSKPENQLFWTLLHDQKVEKVWFTGMLTHGQTDFVINYIDPELHTVRSYYPDFLVKKADGNYVILEVKGDNMIDDSIVEAKSQAARQLATASSMTYQILKGSDVMRGDGI